MKLQKAAIVVMCTSCLISLKSMTSKTYLQTDFKSLKKSRNYAVQIIISGSQ